jgi:hypothetical protein
MAEGLGCFERGVGFVRALTLKDNGGGPQTLTVGYDVGGSSGSPRSLASSRMT